MRRTIIALLVTFGLAGAALAVSTPTAFGQDGGSLIIGVSTCPQGYDGDDFAADCTALPAAPIDFSIGTPNTGNVETTTTGGDGLATFALAPYDLDPTGPDTVTVGEPAAQALEYAVFCTSGGVALDFSYETLDFEPGGPLFGIRFDFETGDDIACEWYNIPQPMNPGDDDGDEVGELPNTGIGAGVIDDDRSGDLLAMTMLLGLVGWAAHGLRRRALA
ncbi:MAG: hypothetical protein ACRDJW_22950 [Thermomicrobiales bacterium]